MDPDWLGHSITSVPGVTDKRVGIGCGKSIGKQSSSTNALLACLGGTGPRTIRAVAFWTLSSSDATVDSADWKPLSCSSPVCWEQNHYYYFFHFYLSGLFSQFALGLASHPALSNHWIAENWKGVYRLKVYLVTANCYTVDIDIPYILAYKPTISSWILTIKLWGSAYMWVMSHNHTLTAMVSTA